MNTFRDQATIVGVGYTEFSQSPGVSNATLAAKACLNAIQDSGLTTKQIHGIASYTRGDSPNATLLLSLLGLEYMNWSWDYTSSGSYAADALIGMAAAATINDLVDYVIVFHVVNRPAVNPQITGLQLLDSVGMWQENQFFNPYGLDTGVHRAALMARLRMLKYGTTEEQLWHVVQTFRENASMNSRALLKDQITFEDYLASPAIAEPLRTSDCYTPAVGACAIIVTTAERAKDLNHKPVYIMATHSGNTIRPDLGFMSPELGECFSKRTGKRLYEQAGISPSDIDAAELHDPFSWTVISQLEDFGFCNEGEGGEFVKDGNIALDGQIPVNTHGGSIAEGELEGLMPVIEAVTQLRGHAESRQVSNAEIILCTSHDIDRGSALILRR
jgi:acetyl-CoA acetyltransferase